MNCGAKHTKPQIPDDDWKCPKCGISVDHPSGGFVVEESAEASDDDCPQLHDEDGVCCNNCGYGASGKTFARLYAKRASLVPCAHCKGSGFVKGSRPLEPRREAATKETPR